MPVNSLSENKKETDKSKFRLSLKKKNVSILSDDNRKVNEEIKENSGPDNKHVDCNDKENKPLKRPLKSTYFNTLHLAKKLKTVQEPQEQPKSAEKPEQIVLEVLQKEAPAVSISAMLNGHQAESGQHSSRKMPIATLSNLGNTCFLNSVLYTLRYAPRFLHNLHHLVSELSSVEQKLGSIRLKSSSLGRSAANLASTGTRSWSSKDLLSLGQSESVQGKSKIQIATEKLHETYANLRAAENKCVNSNSSDAIPEPYAADPFLCALREVNSTFEGNRQQDAHELLVCILDNIRETCRALSARAARLQIHENGDTNGLARQPSLEGDNVKPTLSGLRKSWKRRRDIKTPDALPGIQTPAVVTPPPEPNQDESTRPGWDFVAEDFEGTMVVRTMCVECETVTKRTQAVCDIGVPVSEDGDEDEREPFRSACLSSEYLRDQNKYWCERCLRYNEARRSVAYERLPRLLVLQLKRFSGGMEKITRHAPTPLLLPCFCEPCTRKPDQSPTHRYVLWAVIMHLGQTLSGGHYVAYVRDTADRAKCERESADGPNSVGSGGGGGGGGSGGFMRAFFNRPRPQPVGCSAKSCCVPRPRPESCWLACDDELVKPISNEEFEDLLSAEPKMRSASTPYLLFYVKSEVG